MVTNKILENERLSSSLEPQMDNKVIVIPVLWTEMIHGSIPALHLQVLPLHVWRRPLLTCVSAPSLRIRANSPYLCE